MNAFDSVKKDALGESALALRHLHPLLLSFLLPSDFRLLSLHTPNVEANVLYHLAVFISDSIPKICCVELKVHITTLKMQDIFLSSAFLTLKILINHCDASPFIVK